MGPSTLIGDNVVERIAKLKQSDGPELQVHGSSNLLQTLIANNLIDQYHLLIFPLVLGKGKRLFGGGTVPAGLRLVDSKVSTTGVVIATYEPAGALELGSFALDEGTAVRK
jgi:dihydrofolate reductase